MRLGSSALVDGATIPRRFTCDGEDLSPPLEWTGAPAEARSFVLLCDDPDAPAGTWHRDASPYQPSYIQALQILVQQFSDRPGFKFMSMPDLDGNLDYSDEVHAKPHLAKVWSTRLADTLNSLVCKGTAGSYPTIFLQQRAAGSGK